VEEKLKRLTKRGGSFGYSIGILWLFGDNEEIFFYVNGIKYNTENEVIEILTKHEDSSMNNFINYRKSIKEFEKKIEIINKEGEKAYEEYEENKRIEELENLEQEIHDQDYYESIRIYENALEHQEEERLNNLDIYEKYEETGTWGKFHEMEGEDNYFSKSYFDSEEYLEKQKNEEFGPSDAEIENWEKQQYEQYIQETIEKYKQGMLRFKDFDYSTKEDDGESRKLWFGLWKDLHFISYNSVLFIHRWCIEKLKKLLERALTHNVSLHIFKDDSEKTQAEENLEFLNGWIWYQEEILAKKL